MRRALAWVVVSPLLGAGVLAAHDAAYRLTGTPSEGLHTYLEHAPQVLLLGFVLGFVVLPPSRSRGRVSPRAFVLAAGGIFALQEHLERLVHDGGIPWLLTSPLFLLGLALQVPVALVVWALARWLLQTVEGADARRRPRVPVLLLPIALGVAAPPDGAASGHAHARAPPALRLR
jgi:hypothetical protein